MLRLPRLTAGAGTWDLPLASHTADQLAALFLTNGDKARQPGLAEVLADDPPLALWCVCRTRCWANDPPASLGDVAAWLSEVGPDAAADCVPTLASCAAQPLPLEQWATWLAEDLATARVARRLATDSAAMPSAGAAVTGSAHAAVPSVGHTGAEMMYLLALLARAIPWLTSCGTPISLAECQGGATCLPPWLVSWLMALEQGRIDDPRCAVVIHARRALGLVAARSAAAAPLQAAREYADAVRQRWLATSDGVGQFLPQLLRKLARLRQLETGFQQTLEAEKLAALKALAYGASHEINNPLANISTRAQTLLRDEPDPERRRKLAVIHAQAMRAHEMIADLMLFAQPPPLRAATIDAVELVDQVLQELAPDAAEQGTALVHVTPSGPLWLTADHDHLAVAVKAVCRNALEALSLAGRIEVAVQTAVPPVRDVAGGEWIAIAVHDTGRGIPPEVRRHLFDPYFSGREAGRGLGLGLSKCWRIITDHGGRIDVDSGPDRGTTITLRLPKTGPASRSGGGP